jgi:hypothetical protein
MVMKMTSTLQWIGIQNFSSADNGITADMNIYQTNLLSGWLIESTTNLCAPIIWNTFTNFNRVTTNSGIVDFNLTINPALMSQFWRARGQVTNAVSFSVPISAPSYTTNTI